MTTVDLTEQNFEDVVTKSEIVFVDFWASWCGPCLAFAPTFQRASEKHPDIVFGKVNTEEAQELAGIFKIRAIPTLMVLKNGVIVFSEAGALSPSALEALIKQAQALDMQEVEKQGGASAAAG